MNEKRKYADAEHKLVVCACSDPGHQLILSKYTGEPFEDHELWLTVRLTFDTRWERFKSIFKKKHDKAELLITHKEAEQFVNALTEFNNWEKKDGK